SSDVTRYLTWRSERSFGPTKASPFLHSFDDERELFAFKGDAPLSFVLGFIARLGMAADIFNAVDRFLSRVERIPRWVALLQVRYRVSDELEDLKSRGHRSTPCFTGGSAVAAEIGVVLIGY